MDPTKDWDSSTTLAHGFLILVLALLGYGFGHGLEYRGTSMWWLVAGLLPPTILVLAWPHAGGERFRLGSLRPIALGLLLVMTLLTWRGEEERDYQRSRGDADRIAAAYTKDPRTAWPLLAAADEQTLQEAEGRVPAWMTEREFERRRIERLRIGAAEQRRREEQQRRQDRFAESPLGRALGLVYVASWLLSELIG